MRRILEINWLEQVTKELVEGSTRHPKCAFVHRRVAQPKPLLHSGSQRGYRSSKYSSVPDPAEAGCPRRLVETELSKRVYQGFSPIAPAARRFRYPWLANRSADVRRRSEMLNRTRLPFDVSKETLEAIMRTCF